MPLPPNPENPGQAQTNFGRGILMLGTLLFGALNLAERFFDFTITSSPAERPLLAYFTVACGLGYAAMRPKPNPQP